MKSLILYFLIISVTSICMYLSLNLSNKKYKYFFIFLTIFIPSLFAAIRFGIGTDYQIHQQVFNDIYNNLEITKRAEIGYVFLNKIIVLVGGNYNMLLFLISLISMICIYETIVYFKDSINPTFTMFAYMLLYYQMSYNFIRQILAATIALYGTIWLFKNNTKMAIFISLIASTIHITALIFIPMIVLSKYLISDKFNRNKIIIYFIFTILVFTYPLFIMPFLDFLQNLIPQLRYFFNYLAADYKSIGIGLFRYILLFVLPGLIFYYKMSDICKFYYNICIVGFILWLTSYVTKMEFYRISYTFLISLPLLLGFFFKNCNLWLGQIKYTILRETIFGDNNFICFLIGNKAILFQSFLIILLLFFWYYDYFYLKAHETVPYVSIFGGL